MFHLVIHPRPTSAEEQARVQLGIQRVTTLSLTPSQLTNRFELSFEEVAQRILEEIEPPFNDDRLRLTNLFWRQELDDGRAVVLAGFLDVRDIVDATAGMTSPWLHYMNSAFGTGAAAIGRTSPSWRGPRWLSVSRPYSWRPIPIPTTRRRTGPT